MPSLLVDTTPLRVSPPFRRLWLGLSVGQLGAQLTVVAVGLQVYALTSSTFAVGILGLCALVPLVVFGLYGGALVDHADRRTVALVASTLAWLVTMALAAQAWAGNERVEVLYALVALQSAAAAVNSPARSAIIPRLLDPRLMPAANALQTLGGNTAMTVGPLLGAGLVAVLDYAAVYTLDALLFTFALAALVRLPPVPPEPSADRRARVGLGSVLDGLRYLGTRPNVRMTFLVDLVAMITSMPRVLFPAVGVLYLGGQETTTGLMTASVAVGGIVAGLFSGRSGGRALAGADHRRGDHRVGPGRRRVRLGAGERRPHVTGPRRVVGPAGRRAHARGRRVRRTRSARCSGRRSCRRPPRTTCAGGCRACSSWSSPAVRGSAS